MDVIILAGGLGTRLKSVTKDTPKPMATVLEKPFLEYTLDCLSKQKVENVILAVSYMHERIEEYFKDEYKGMKIYYSVEELPLDTGGALEKAIQISKEKNVIVMYGDIIANVNLEELMKTHIKSNADITITAKQMEKFDRFGTVEIENGFVKKFKEKQYTEKGYVNAGIYAINKKRYLSKAKKLEERFSFEKDLLEKSTFKKIGYYQYEGKFLDIGIPEDYKKAEQYL